MENLGKEGTNVGEMDKAEKLFGTEEGLLNKVGMDELMLCYLPSFFLFSFFPFPLVLPWLAFRVCLMIGRGKP